MSDSDKNAEKTQKKVIGRPFKKGNKMSPGRPKKEFCIPDILRKIGQEIDPVSKKNKYDAMCEKAWSMAIKGDTSAREFVASRMEGRALERVQMHEVKDELIIE